MTRGHQDLTSLEPVISSALSEVEDADLRNDLRQDVYERLLRASDRLDPSTMDAYAYVVARNVLLAHRRREAAYKRAIQRAPVPDNAVSDDPPPTLDPRTRRAMRAAWAELHHDDRAMLRARDVERQPTKEISREEGLSPGAVRLRTLRARAHLRVRFVLARRNMRPATGVCLPVLDAIAAGDQRRQRQLHAAEHLVRCELCADVAEDVCARRRSPVWLAWTAVAGAGAWLWRAIRNHPWPTAASAAAAVVVGVAIVNVLAERAPPPTVVESITSVAPSTAVAPTVPAPSALTANGTPLHPASADLRGLRGANVVGTDVPVLEVVGDEAFWVGASADDRILVVLVSPGESPQSVRAGQMASFSGSLVEHDASFPEAIGVVSEDGAGLARSQAAHVEVAAAALELR